MDKGGRGVSRPHTGQTAVSSCCWRWCAQLAGNDSKYNACEMIRELDLWALHVGCLQAVVISRQPMTTSPAADRHHLLICKAYRADLCRRHLSRVMRWQWPAAGVHLWLISWSWIHSLLNIPPSVLILGMLLDCESLWRFKVSTWKAQTFSTLSLAVTLKLS